MVERVPGTMLVCELIQDAENEGAKLIYLKGNIHDIETHESYQPRCLEYNGNRVPVPGLPNDLMMLEREYVNSIKEKLGLKKMDSNRSKLGD